MAVTATFLATCKTAIVLLPEYAAFNTARATWAAASRASKPVYWHAAFSDAQPGLSPAYRLRKAIRETVKANGDGSVTAIDQESAYRTLVALYVNVPKKPMSKVDEAAAIQQLINEDRVS